MIRRRLIRVNSSISHLARSGDPTAAVELFSGVLHSTDDLTPDQYSLSSAVSARTTSTPQLHCLAIKTNLIAFRHVHNSLLSFYSKTHLPILTHKLYDEFDTPDDYSRTSLLSAYAKVGRVDIALDLFDEMPKRNAAVWNAVITGCVENGCDGLAMEMFGRMRRVGVAVDRYCCVAVLNVCGESKKVRIGKQVHGLVVRCGIVVWESVASVIVSMYFRCGLVGDGWRMFGEASTSVWGSVVVYNAVVAGLVDNGMEFDGFEVFKRMLSEVDCLRRPNEITFLSILGSCSVKEIGEQVHGLALKVGYVLNTLTGNAAVAMYSRCEDLGSAELVFSGIDEKDIVSWNSLISAYCRQECYESAITAYARMQETGIRPDDFTLGSIVACCRVKVQVEMMQAIVLRTGLIGSTEVCNSLISAFSKVGDVTNAFRVFDSMISTKNLISWNSILCGCLLNDLPLQSLELFSDLTRMTKPNSHTLSTVLSVCATMSFLGYGKQIHAHIVRIGHDADTLLQNALVTMYSKCGCLSWSERVFHQSFRRDAFSWNSMIAAYAQHGKGEQAVRCFRRMKMPDSGVQPDHITFTTILSACSHSGFIDEGREIFSSMLNDYGVKPEPDHYSCLVDLLGRSGYLDEAEHIISTMPYELEPHVWWALLSACSVYGNVKLGRTAAKVLLEMEPDNPTVYVLLSNVNAAAGQWEEACSVREQMAKNGLLKKPGCSWIQSPSNPSPLHT